MADNATFQILFEKAQLNPNTQQIKGNICGVKIEEVANTLTKQVRYLYKLVDELAKGKAGDKIVDNG